MEFPGEKLLLKLWETLSEKGIGPLFKPNQLKREGLASIAIDRAKVLIEAQTQKDAEQIRLGEKELSDFSMELKFAKSDLKSNHVARVEPTLSSGSLRQIAIDKTFRDAVRNELNTTGAIICAADLLKEDVAQPSDEKINEDWLFRWRDYTGEVSTADLQLVWGRVLAGEIKSPGSYSLRCLDFLRSISREEAELIEAMSCLVIGSFIWKPKVDSSYTLPLGYDRILELEELGLIGNVGGGLGVSMKDSSDEPSWIKVLVSNGKCLVVRNTNKAAVLNIPAYAVTKLGVQVAALGNAQPNIGYLQQLARTLIMQGFTVSLADMEDSSPDYLKWKDEVVLV